MPSRILARVGYGTLCLIAIALGVAAAPRTSGLGPPKVVSSKLLPDGALKQVWSNGSVSVATPGSVVDVRSGQSGGSGSITPPDPGTSAGYRAMARLYAANHRTPVADLRAAGVTPTSSQIAASKQIAALESRPTPSTSCRSSVYDSGTLVNNTQSITQHGAYTRYTTCDSDASNHYTYDLSEMSGQGYSACNGLLNHCAITEMGTAHSYTNGAMVRWAPLGDMQTGSACAQQTIGLNAFGANISKTVQVCPDRIHPDTPFKGRFAVHWLGCEHEGNTRAADALSSQKLRNGVGGGFRYMVGFTKKVSGGPWSAC